MKGRVRQENKMSATRTALQRIAGVPRNDGKIKDWMIARQDRLRVEGNWVESSRRCLYTVELLVELCRTNGLNDTYYLSLCIRFASRILFG